MRREIEQAHARHVRDLLRPKRERPAPPPPEWEPLPYEPDAPFPNLSPEERARAVRITGRTPEESYRLFLTRGARRAL